jgi:hypothetical protein
MNYYESKFITDDEIKVYSRTIIALPPEPI